MDKEILQVVEQIKKEIFESYVSKGLVASGEFGRDLKVNDLGDRVTITAPHYVVQMVQGRKAGSFRLSPLLKSGFKTRTGRLVQTSRRKQLSPSLM